jgi:hypothetical protein
MDMLNVFGNQVFDFPSILSLHDEYCAGGQDDLNDTPVETTGIAKTLRSLTVVECCALVDVVERIWHVEGLLPPGWSNKQIADAVGLKLRD